MPAVDESRKRAERRLGVRLEVDLPVKLEVPPGRAAAARMRNASVSGALIECAEEVPVFTPLRVQIQPLDRSREPLQLTARVVRSEHPWLGIEWREFEPQPIAELLEQML